MKHNYNITLHYITLHLQQQQQQKQQQQKQTQLSIPQKVVIFYKTT